MFTQTPVDRTFAASGPAEPDTVARLRGEVDEWVGDVVPVDAQRRADILLATDEALSNCADHAYRDRSGGAMSIELTFRPDDAQLEVRVVDDGTWTRPARRRSALMRGRGIMLMRALTDGVDISGGSRGTTVRLRFSGCRASGRVGS